ncbi:MAG: hypothetical protein VX589_13630 [Myxococcota bacterium]|nr:hypothetical protein [Myxococcota bacterium]
MNTVTHTIDRSRAAMTAAFGGVLALIALSTIPRIANADTVQASLWVAAVLCALAVVALRGKPLAVSVQVRLHHVVQFAMHSAIFVYWATIVGEVVDQAWLYLAQILVAYLLDFLLSWWRRGTWIVGLGPLPVVGSINLFLWFKDDWWYLQLLMVFIAFASKPFLRWTRDGRNTHIFNPSAIALALLSVGVLTFGATDITWGPTIARTLNAPTFMFETIFAVGLVVQLLFGTTLVTAGAALTVWGVGLLYFESTGWWFFNDTHIPIAVFLGMNLLITDPSTSPESKMGRLLYGAVYGLAVFPLWMILEAHQTPTFYDKLLQVPLLNLAVPLFEWAGRRLANLGPKLKAVADNRLHVAVWIVAFVVLRPGLVEHPGKAVSHGYMFAHGVGGAAKDPAKAARLFRKACDQGQPIGCTQLGQLRLGGQGVPANPQRAIELFERACRADEPVACNQLGIIYVDGVHTARNPQKARALYAKACDLSDASSCGNLGLMYRSGQGGASDETKASQYLKKACKLGHGLACKVVDAPTNTGTAGPSRAPEQACESGDGAACGMLAQRLERTGTSTERTRALDLYKRACNLKHAPSCNALGSKYATGQGVPKTPAKAAQYAEQACNLGDYHACGNLGGMHLEGHFGRPDLKRAQALFKKACGGGVERACAFLKRLRSQPSQP